MLKALVQDECVKSKKRKIETLCILCNEACSEKCKLQEVGWNSMRENAKAWIGLDTFGTVSETVDWENDPEIYFLHNNCKLKLHNARPLDQAKKKVVVGLVILKPSLGVLQLDLFIQKIFVFGA